VASSESMPPSSAQGPVLPPSGLLPCPPRQVFSPGPLADRGGSQQKRQRQRTPDITNPMSPSVRRNESSAPWPVQHAVPDPSKQRVSSRDNSSRFDDLSRIR